MGKLAIVVNNELYEITIQFYAAKSKEMMHETKVFKNIEKALKWIGLKNLPEE